jgi:hypothetical protein
LYPLTLKVLNNGQRRWDMTAGETNQIADVVRRVQDWPAPLRVALARRILETLESPAVDQPPPQLPRGPSAAEIAALFKTDKPAPTDEEVQRILEDELLRKYGS